jgi:hypothetical protein
MKNVTNLQGFIAGLAYDLIALISKFVPNKYLFIEWQNDFNRSGSRLKGQRVLFSNSSTVLPAGWRNSYLRMGGMFCGTVVAQLSMMLLIWVMQGNVNL